MANKGCIGYQIKTFASLAKFFIDTKGPRTLHMKLQKCVYLPYTLQPFFHKPLPEPFPIKFFHSSRVSHVTNNLHLMIPWPCHARMCKTQSWTGVKDNLLRVHLETGYLSLDMENIICHHVILTIYLFREGYLCIEKLLKAQNKCCHEYSFLSSIT